MIACCCVFDAHFVVAIVVLFVVDAFAGQYLVPGW